MTTSPENYDPERLKAELIKFAVLVIAMLGLAFCAVNSELSPTERSASANTPAMTQSIEATATPVPQDFATAVATISPAMIIYVDDIYGRDWNCIHINYTTFPQYFRADLPIVPHPSVGYAMLGETYQESLVNDHLLIQGSEETILPTLWVSKNNFIANNSLVCVVR